MSVCFQVHSVCCERLYVMYKYICTGFKVALRCSAFRRGLVKSPLTPFMWLSLILSLTHSLARFLSLFLLSRSFPISSFPSPLSHSQTVCSSGALPCDLNLKCCVIHYLSFLSHPSFFHKSAQKLCKTAFKSILFFLIVITMNDIKHRDDPLEYNSKTVHYVIRSVTGHRGLKNCYQGKMLMNHLACGCWGLLWPVTIHLQSKSCPLPEMGQQRITIFK